MYVRLLSAICVMFFALGCSHDPWRDVPESVASEPDSGDCDIREVSFRRDIVPIMERHCYICHKGAMASGAIFLDTYKGVKSVADDGRLIGSVQGDPGYLFMPEAAPALSDCNIRKIVAWIANSSVEN